MDGTDVRPKGCALYKGGAPDLIRREMRSPEHGLLEGVSDMGQKEVACWGGSRKSVPLFGGLWP